MRICVAVLLAFGSVLYGQGLTSEGREFYLGHIHGTHLDVSSAFTWSQQRVYAIVSSYQDNEIYVSYFNPQTGVETSPNKYYISAFGSVQVLLDDIVMRASEPGDIAEYRSCHIIAKHPVTVHYYRTGSCVTGGYLALPIGTWGKQYVVASDPDNPGYGGVTHPPEIDEIDKSNGCFMVIAAMNNTKVTISPNVQTGGGHPGATQGPGATGSPQPYSVTLHRGQTYLVKSISALSDNSDDISGSIVKADKPIAVITAHENANVGDGITIELNNTDARDLLIEQAIPWEYAADSGIYSFPMADSKGALEGGYGEDVKMFVADEGGASSLAVKNCSNTTIATVGIAPFAIPPTTRANVTQALQYTCDTGKRIQAVQYELRSDGEGVPYPAPAMMHLIPKRSWRNAYVWYIPAKPPAPEGLQPYEEYYVTITGTPDITPNLSNIVRTVNCGGLRATTYKINSGVTYYARSNSPFMVYVFGYVGTRDLPPPQDPTMTYGGFSFPAGMRGKAVYRKERSLAIDTTLEESCSTWKVCASDKEGNGIKSIVLISDPDNYFTYDELNSHNTWPDIIYGSLIFNNCIIENPTSLDNQEILKLIPEQNLCATIRVIDTTQDAYAPIAITDAEGNIRIVELFYNGKQLTTDSTFKGFAGVDVGDTAERRVVARSKNSFTVNTITVSDSSVLSFTVNKALPIDLFSGDSMIVMVSFAPKDTLPMSAKLTFSNECMSVDQSFTAKGATGLIYAEDKDFGNIAFPSIRCQEIRIDNKGSAAFSITSMTSSDPKFVVDSTGPAELPILLNPGTFVKVKVCYHPTEASSDTALLQLGTDINPPYANSIKPTSVLTGRGVQQSVGEDLPGPITLHPNPNNGKFIMDLTEVYGRVGISVFNSLGVEYYHTRAEGGRPVELQLPQLVAGVYTVRVTTTTQIHDLRLVIQ